MKFSGLGPASCLRSSVHIEFSVMETFGGYHKRNPGPEAKV